MDVMIDLETLGNKETTAVVSIGVVVFDIDKKTILDKYYATLDVQNQLKKGRTVVADVLKWWMNQPNSSKKVFAEDAKDPKVALKEIWTMLDKYRPLTVWGNGSGFDINIVENMYDMYEERLPWHYTHVNDLRTFIRFVGKRAKVEKGGTNHNALDDAISQVNYIFKHYNKETGQVEIPSSELSPVANLANPEKANTPETEVPKNDPKEVVLATDVSPKDLNQIIVDDIKESSINYAKLNATPGTTDKGREMLANAYTAGANEWAARFEGNSKKMWDLIEAFRKADESMMGKELTEELMKNSMTLVRDAIGAIVGEKGLHG